MAFSFFQATIIFHLTTVIYFLSRVKYTHRNPGTPHHPIMASRSKSKISPSISGPARLPGDISSGTTPLILGTYTTKRQVFCPPHTQNTLVRQDDHSRYSYSRCKIGGGGESLFDGSSEVELAHHQVLLKPSMHTFSGRVHGCSLGLEPSSPFLWEAFGSTLWTLGCLLTQPFFSIRNGPFHS